MICRRPASVIVRLSIRIIVREFIAAAGPFLVIYFQEEIPLYFDDGVAKSAIILGYSILANVGSYMIGAAVGVLIEASCRCCCNKCIGSSNTATGDRELLTRS